jgi:3-hydroxyacyl-CoA dehydrogenase
MMANGWLGDKSGQGYYKKVGPAKEIHAINLQTLAYAPAQKVKFPAAEEAKQLEDMPARLRKLVAGTDRVGTFLWSLYSDLFVYCAERIPEISDRCVEIDRAMKWGYAHKYGPFELWDALGFEAVCKRLEAEKRNIPANIEAMRKAGATSFYATNDHGGNPGAKYFNLGSAAFADLEERKGVTVIADLKRARGVVKSNPGASLVDLGDGVVCVEFHSKMNSLGEDIFAMMQAGIEAIEGGGYDALVIANQGQDFCVGANLAMALMAAQEEEWDDLNLGIHRFQQLNMRLKYASKPVVVAPFARTLGGGCEIQLHASKVQAAAEVYMGLVEVGVGLIPGGGGTKEMIARLKDPRKCFEIIGMAKVSSSADDAKAIGLLARDAGISMNTERLVADAKEAALALVPGYTAPNAKPIKVGGAPAKALLNVGLWSMRQGGYISDYDVEVGKKLAHILSGGDLSGESEVSEQYLLDLEREAFLSLCGSKKTQDRMAHMLKTGKPLRN